jgi:hypothetical protein
MGEGPLLPIADGGGIAVSFQKTVWQCLFNLKDAIPLTWQSHIYLTDINEPESNEARMFITGCL